MSRPDPRVPAHERLVLAGLEALAATRPLTPAERRAHAAQVLRLELMAGRAPELK